MKSPAKDTEPIPRHGYHGRVRSGCFTCRSRKVKCDETRPVCKNCIRINRSCAYGPKRQRTVARPKEVHKSGRGLSEAEQSQVSKHNESPHQERGSPGSLDAVLRLDQIPWRTEADPFIPVNSSISDVTTRLGSLLSSPGNAAVISHDDATLDMRTLPEIISRDIELTTTIDILATPDIHLRPWLTFFIEAVDVHFITPFDALNWRRMKLEVVELAGHNKVIATAIIAISMLYKGLVYALPVFQPFSLYESAKASYLHLLANETRDFISTDLVVMFLLCLFEFVHYQVTPVHRNLDEMAKSKIEAWAKCETYSTHSVLSLRISAWLRLMHTTTIHGGCMGLISDDICRLLPQSTTMLVNLRPHITGEHLGPSTELYELFSGPIFDFYLQLQTISGRISKQTHYHRSRSKGSDQEEVVAQLKQFRTELHALWDNRSALHRHGIKDLRSILPPKISKPIIALIGICTAAYYSEFIVMDRLLRDPMSDSLDSKHAMNQIREIVDGDWNAYDRRHGGNGPSLNPGYLRPLFLYAIECFDYDKSLWAVDKILEIQSHSCRSAFFATFAKALANAQLSQGRRVTSKFFCFSNFGAPPPYM